MIRGVLLAESHRREAAARWHRSTWDDARASVEGLSLAGARAVPALGRAGPEELSLEWEAHPP